MEVICLIPSPDRGKQAWEGVVTASVTHLVTGWTSTRIQGFCFVVGSLSSSFQLCSVQPLYSEVVAWVWMVKEVQAAKRSPRRWGSKPPNVTKVTIICYISVCCGFCTRFCLKKDNIAKTILEVSTVPCSAFGQKCKSIFFTISHDGKVSLKH